MYQSVGVIVRKLSEATISQMVESFFNDTAQRDGDNQAIEVNGRSYEATLVFAGATLRRLVLAVFQYEELTLASPRATLGFFGFWKDAAGAWHQIEQGLVHANPRSTDRDAIPETQILSITAALAQDLSEML